MYVNYRRTCRIANDSKINCIILIGPRKNSHSNISQILQNIYQTNYTKYRAASIGFYVIDTSSIEIENSQQPFLCNFIEPHENQQN